MAGQAGVGSVTGHKEDATAAEHLAIQAHDREGRTYPSLFEFATSETNAIVPTRMSTFSKSSNVIVSLIGDGVR